MRILVFHGFYCRYKNQNVAIKIVHKGDTPEEAAKRETRFAREVSMMARVQHKNLVKVSIFGFVDLVICLWSILILVALMYSSLELVKSQSWWW